MWGHGGGGALPGRGTVGTAAQEYLYRVTVKTSEKKVKLSKTYKKKFNLSIDLDH